MGEAKRRKKLDPNSETIYINNNNHWVEIWRDGWYVKVFPLSCSKEITEEQQETLKTLNLFYDRAYVIYDNTNNYLQQDNYTYNSPFKKLILKPLDLYIESFENIFDAITEAKNILKYTKYNSLNIGTIFRFDEYIAEKDVDFLMQIIL